MQYHYLIKRLLSLSKFLICRVPTHQHQHQAAWSKSGPSRPHVPGAYGTPKFHIGAETIKPAGEETSKSRSPKQFFVLWFYHVSLFLLLSSLLITVYYCSHVPMNVTKIYGSNFKLNAKIKLRESCFHTHVCRWFLTWLRSGPHAPTRPPP
jgi:hypothetical protein